MRFSLPLAAALFVSLSPLAALAAPSTSHGQVSVAQVMELIEAAHEKRQSAQLLTAYLAGIGETVGILTAARRDTGKPYVTCARAVTIDDSGVRLALTAAAPKRQDWTEIPATPIVVASVIEQAGCK